MKDYTVKWRRYKLTEDIEVFERIEATIKPISFRWIRNAKEGVLFWEREIVSPWEDSITTIFSTLLPTLIVLGIASKNDSSL